MHLDVRLIHRNEPVCSCMQCDAVDVNAIECIFALHTCFVEPLLNSNEKGEKVVKNCLVFSVMQAYASDFCIHPYASAPIGPPRPVEPRLACSRRCGASAMRPYASFIRLKAPL